MSRQPLFAGLIVDENDRPVGTASVGDEPCYVVDDAGFRRHIPSEQVDRQVLQMLASQIQGSEGLVAEQTAKMLGQEDPFSRAIIENQLKHLDQQFETILQTGFPEESRAYMGMLGFRVRINLHGEIIGVDQPGAVDDSGEE